MNNIKKHKKKIYVIVSLCCLITIISTVRAYSISEVEYVIPYLEFDDIWTTILRNLGQWLYNFLATFLDMAEEGFTSLMNWDIMALPKVQEIISRLDVVLYSLLFIAFIGIVVTRMFMFENNLKTLYNVFMTMLIMTSLTVILGLMGNAKTDLIAEADNIIKGNTQDTIAEALYKDNSVDVVRSMQQGKVMRLSDVDGLNLDYVKISTRISKSMLNEYYSYNEDSTIEIEKLSNGLLGFGDERYFRYHIDFTSINITVFFSTIIYGLAIFKLAYLIWQWLQVNMFSKIALGRGFWDLGNIGKVLKSAMNTLGGMVILYFSMMLFTVMTSSIMTSDSLPNMIAKAIVIFAIGMSIVVGSGYINEFMGIDDGSSFAIKSLFTGRALGRMASNTVKKSSDIASSIGDKFSKVGKGVDSYMDKKVRDTVDNAMDDAAQKQEDIAQSKEEERMKRQQERDEEIEQKSFFKDKFNSDNPFGKVPTTEELKKRIEKCKQQDEKPSVDKHKELQEKQSQYIKVKNENGTYSIKKRSDVEKNQRQYKPFGKVNIRKLPDWYHNQDEETDSEEIESFDKEAFLEKLNKLCKKNDEE